ncbi:DUF721 domain-containing protein [Acidovorax sp.]|uniref:DUF721 domain-containing protein n=1 Tax=Acidovorax sp. TaxID=1872122 RepID=UPI000BCF8BB8|nr:DUF721 domain-containing protein [Acidovorax sp.]OYW65711.1 MAG: hypothetical protein B7Z32_01985 [Hydrogenophilales bacterium 12-64-13]OYZ06651.1 MAG: hypothetical protein B7Y26_02285 [Hydrogenophilales bacterium 16-64-46]OZA39359.1 MAG: hypothetical protein B7X87_03390 [Hydrogenophilales bacterium 17-64-34]HQT01331.1 DUF721 domain-containing protein [Thiobacillus sp.]
MSAESLGDLLARQMPAGVATRAQALLKLQAALDRALPAALAGHVRVRTLDAGLLSLACASGAQASRLKQQTDSLIAALASRGAAVDSVRVSVDPALLAPYAPPADKPGLPPAALDGLAQLETGMEEGPLKDALARLLRHHRPGR